MKNEMNLVWFIFHIIQISLFQFYAAPKLSTFSWIILKKRNPEVAKEKLGIKNSLHPAMLDYLIGGISILVLLTGFFMAEPLIYWSGKYLSLFGFLFTTLGLDFFQYEKLKKKYL